VDSEASGASDYIVDYVASGASEGHYYCDSSGLHYITDPTGWGIQLDLAFSSAAGSKLCTGATTVPPSRLHSLDNFCPCTGMVSCGANYLP